MANHARIVRRRSGIFVIATIAAITLLSSLSASGVLNPSSHVAVRTVAAAPVVSVDPDYGRQQDSASRSWHRSATCTDDNCIPMPMASSPSPVGNAVRVAAPPPSAPTATRTARATTYGGSGVNAGPAPASCSSYSGNRKIGCTLLLKWGWGLGQMSCLDKLWTRESGWSTSSYNSGSGAYGIPQSLPGSKMASAGSDWRTNPATQITWGLGYIKGRYGSPCAAWAHSQATGWY